MTEPGRLHVDQNFSPHRRGDVDVFKIESVSECIRADKDPKAERDRIKRVADILAKTVPEVFDEWVAAKFAKRSPQTLKITRYRIKRYILPHIGDMRIQQVDTNVILDTVGLRRLWVERNPTAVYVHNILKRMFSFAIASNYYVGDNPAAWRDHLEHVLPASKDVHKTIHHPSLPHREVGRFLEALRSYEDRSPRAMGHPTVALWLEFVVLSAVRISEARLATWSEIDEENGIWVVPAPHHKNGRITHEPHLVPITKPMWNVLTQMKQCSPDRRPDSLIFPSSQNGGRGCGRGRNRRSANRPFDVTTVTSFCRQSLRWPIDLTPHGFRSTFNDWARANGYSEDLRDMQVGHLPRGKVAQAYVREQLVNERRPMMEAWGDYCSCPAPEAADIINLESFAEQRDKRKRAS